jgi:hypothetical protein
MWIRRLFVLLLLSGSIADRSWAQAVPTSGNACIASYGGVFQGDINVGPGQTCSFTGGGVTGNVQVNGGNLLLADATVGGSVQINGGNFSIGPSTVINGTLQVQNLQQGTSLNQICGSTVYGDLQLQNNGAAVQIGSAAQSVCAGNVISGNLQVQGNAGATSMFNNIVLGNVVDQNNTGVSQVFSNTVTQNLQCQGNASITGGQNTAQQVQGQCAGFPSPTIIAAQQLTNGNACNGVYAGVFNGNVAVSAGQTCTFQNGLIIGNVQSNGGNLVLSRTVVGGNVQINGGGNFSIGPSSAIQGTVQVQNLPPSPSVNSICGSTMRGDVQLQNNGAAIQIGSVSGSCWGNAIGHNLQIQNNTGSIQVVGNAVEGRLQCQNDSSLLEGPNAAPQQQGQCAGAASYSIIVEIMAGANINSIASALQAQVRTQMPGAGTYLLIVSSLSPSAYLLPGVLQIETNSGISLAGPKGGILQIGANTGPAWYSAQPAFKLIEADRALSLAEGTGVIIADINSLVDYSHPALAGHLTAGYDFVSGNPVGSALLNQSSATFLDQSSATFLDQSSASFLDQSSATFLDQSSATFLDQSSATFLDQSSATFLDASNPFHGHGTLVAGILAAIAPQSMIMPLRVFDDSGNADSYTIATAIRYAVDHGAQVINMSFSTTDDSKALKDALDYANKAAVVLVASAGNDNTDHPLLPASAGNVIGVAATDLLDIKAPFSNYGGYLQVSAPGVNIIAPYPGGHYALVSGTSFSAPIVAGEAALIQSLHLGNANIKDKVGKATINVDQKNHGKNLGHGRIDVLYGLTVQ